MLLFAALVALAVQARDTLVHLDYGTVRGVTSFSGRSRTFHNIPYAAAPIGNLRFRPPQPPKPFRGIYDPSVAGNACMVSTSLLINFKARPSEDCLNLNIISPPSAEAGDDLPVIVYVYGGGFTDGYANFPWIRGAKNIIEKEHNVIIVTVNYRVGAFGLMPSRELETEGSLNAGLHDLVAAFKWVRKNIAKFGGDPRSVTAMGLSSGGISLAALLTAKDGTLDLFDRAVLQSGSVSPFLETTTTTKPFMDALSKRIGCYGPKVIACFRNATADDLLQAQLDVTATFESPLTTIFQPLLDNKLFTRSPYDALASGQFLRIPLMISTVLDEGNYFTITKVKDLESSIKFRRSMFKWMTRSEYAQLERIYPNDSEFHGSSQMLTDFYFACPARRLATTYAKANLPVYKTFMTHAVGVLQMFKPFGACHGSDIPFWWQFQAIMTPSLFDIAGGQERQLSKAMLDGLLDFAYGKRLIGGKGLPRWPNYTSGNALELRIPIKSVRTFKDNRLDRTCEFLDKAVKAHDGVGMGTPKFGSVMLSNIEARIATTFGWATDYFLRAVFYSE